jgi:WD40 repeat protein
MKEHVVPVLIASVFMFAGGPCFEQDPKELATLKGHTESVACVAFSPDSRTLASASMDMSIKLWDVASGKERATHAGYTSWVRSVAFSTNGELLASGMS